MTIQKTEDIRTLADIQEYDVTSEFASIILPLLERVHKYCQEEGIPHVFAASVAVARDESGTPRETHTLMAGSVSPLRDAALATATDMLSVSDIRTLGDYLAGLCSANPDFLRAIVNGLVKRGLAMTASDALRVQQTPQQTIN